MKTYIKVSIFIIVASVFGTELTSAEADEPPQQNDSYIILKQVLAQFPKRPLEMEGSLLIKNRKGFIAQSYHFNAIVNVNTSTPTAKYSFFIPESKSFLTLETALHPDGSSKTIFKKGLPPKVFEAPPLDSPILGSDITWENLSLQFLKWTNTVYVGSDTVLGLNCSIIKLYPTAYIDTDHYKIWVAQRNHALMRFEEYDADNKLKRTIWIKSLKKIDDGFTVKDLEAESFPVIHRTKIKINSIYEVGE